MNLGFDDPFPENRYDLGLRQNFVQFSLLALLTALVGASMGIERTTLPPLARSAFGITSLLYTVSFISAFGVVKSVMNLFAGRWSDLIGRKPLLVAGWIVGLIYPLLIIFATHWWEVIVANLALGVNQALAWTMTVTGKIDLVGPKNRGLAVGINEASGYIGISIGGLAGGLLASAYGLRPAPYVLALVIIVLGGLLSIWPVKETLPWARVESASLSTDSATSKLVNDEGKKEEKPLEVQSKAGSNQEGSETGMRGDAAIGSPRLASVLALVSWRDRASAAACQAGLINKFSDSLVIGFFPLFMHEKGASLATIGLVVAIYAFIWGILQIPSGWLSDRIGRKTPIVVGQFLVALGIAVVVSGSSPLWWSAGAAVMGIGTALVYPTLIAVVGDVAHPSWRGNSLGVYRLWRDGGYAIGPIVIAIVAGALGLDGAFWFTAVLSAVSGTLVAVMMYETEQKRRKAPSLWISHPDWYQ